MTTDHALDGIFPIVPTIFDDRGELDEIGQLATIDYLLAAGVHGVVVLANASEGYAITDAERPQLIASVVRHVAGRMPVVATCNHPGTIGAVRYAREAQGLGADAVMFLPPFFGQWLSDLDGIRRHSEALARATTVPLILQDHPLSGITMPAPFLVDLARTVDRLTCFKVESMRGRRSRSARCGSWARARCRLFLGARPALYSWRSWSRAPTGLCRVACCRMCSCGCWTGTARVTSGRPRRCFARYLPLIAFETHLGGQRAVKELLVRCRGTIRSPFIRGPIRSGWDEHTARAFRRLVADADLLPSPPAA